jgi:electron transport complex protein RnfB
MDPRLIYSIVTLAGIGTLFGAGLAYASRKFAVYVDPKVERISEVLPNTNCGSCGQAGCSGFAEAVAAGRAPANGCVPGGPEVAEQVAAIMGVAATAVEEPPLAVVRCQGGREEARERFIYRGIEDCKAAQLVASGSKACMYGCLGLGSCVRACPFGAMTMGENGLPIVSEELCTGCGLCVAACPRGIIELIPRTQRVYLGCISQGKAKEVKAACSVGCIACTLCAGKKAPPTGGITMEGNLPKIDYTICQEWPEANEVCPVNAFVLRNGGRLRRVSADESGAETPAGERIS